MRSRLLLILVLLEWIPLALFGGFSYYQAKAALEQKEMDQLVAVRDLKVREIEAYFQQMEGQVRTLSRSPAILDALAQLPDAFARLSKGFHHTEMGALASDKPVSAESRYSIELEHELMFDLDHFYRQTVLPSLSKMESLDVEALIPSAHAGHRAQGTGRSISISPTTRLLVLSESGWMMLGMVVAIAKYTVPFTLSFEGIAKSLATMISFWWIQRERCSIA